jgi:hypothetical protein
MNPHQSGHRYVSAEAESKSQIGLGQRGRIIHVIADQRDSPSGLL